ncbi:helix-turn-helix transcriptional regulator [Tritonibacter horizontis]|uniref:Bifunctional ligase/repressor BirA n=1 Tax=Tritonibacter horizontis TaxID=1768241 RepID=A0A132BZD8_9RHOB|nr:YafY family protein [Tritonibacter horizontis]KUP93743.1 bifunctional ligase/repressor BirA [Tritonibacter horizontis]
MSRSDRLFELIQILRTAKGPMRAEDLGARLEVSKRTIYRDIVALQAMRTPVEGEAGIGYVLRKGYDLPPLNFDEEEIEALHVGLAMLIRTGDGALQQAAARVGRKICDVHKSAEWLQVAPYGAPQDNPDCGCVPIAVLRQAVRSAQKLRLAYVDKENVHSERVLRPLALIYHVECTLLVAWCELRHGFRHFRTDRMIAADLLEDRFSADAPLLRKLWQEQEDSSFVHAP